MLIKNGAPLNFLIILSFNYRLHLIYLTNNESKDLTMDFLVLQLHTNNQTDVVLWQNTLLNWICTVGNRCIMVWKTDTRGLVGESAAK